MSNKKNIDIKKEEIANEISQNKKIADILGNRLASKNFFPPC